MTGPYVPSMKEYSEAKTKLIAGAKGLPPFSTNQVTLVSATDMKTGPFGNNHVGKDKWKTWLNIPKIAGKIDKVAKPAIAKMKEKVKAKEKGKEKVREKANGTANNSRTNRQAKELAPKAGNR